MKKGFTMIELIFVIVILGILAAVAIPRLAATSDDAEVSKAATNLNTALSDITAFYTAKGKFNLSDQANSKPILSDMTGVQFGAAAANQASDTGNIQVKKKDCIQLKVVDASTDGTPAYVMVKKVGTDAICAMVAANPGVASALTSKFSYTKTAAGATTPTTATLPESTEKDTGYIKVGGTGVEY